MSNFLKECDENQHKPTEQELNRIRVVSRNKDSEEFIKSFERTLKGQTGYDSLHRLDYHVDDKGNRWIYVTYKNSIQKRLPLTSDSGIGIMRDFSAQIHSAELVKNEDKVEEFLPKRVQPV